ncbi:DUF4352 domain-containing protein [Streptomyces subrutilus]|uniref:DUF4352 domain-containing protein n=1 Tax=Streptomyces subrutilus TaxID=36818 RepID=A0A1E5P0J8_9ACTN|nr:DUF4352 domain-containing protein [Streptomyces subrutilus]OEJ22554.1 hypothetical protein BGK67_34115 [Streptomyces subrutilus]
MRTHHTAAILATAATLALTACGPADIKTKPDAATPTSATAADAPAASSSAPAAQTATIGSTLTLKGTGDGEQIAVTVKKWVDPAVSKNEYVKPTDGSRYVAAQLELVNTGTAPYDDSPSNGAKVADAEGQQFNSTLTMGITAGPELPSGVKIAPGGKALGYIVFEVPKDSKVALLHFGLNSGFAEQTGQWTIQ